MRSVTNDIINDKAIQLLQDLESLQLIRVRQEKAAKGSQSPINWEAKYKGAMHKLYVIEIDKQLGEIRNAWELNHAERIYRDAGCPKMGSIKDLIDI